MIAKGGFAAAAALLMPAAARAMRLDELDAPRQRLLVDACETRKAHLAVMDELMRKIEGTGVAEDEARKRVAAMDCPFCGCAFASLDLPAEGENPKF